MNRTPRRTAIAGLGLSLTLAVGLAVSPADAATPTKVTTNTATRCAVFTYQTPTDWYFPSGSPKALVWLQHGFTESKNQFAGFANQLAGESFLVVATTLPSFDLFGCTVNNTGNNTAYLNNVATLFGTKNDAAGALNKSFVAARTAAGRPDVQLPGAMAFVGHSAGGEAVTYVANRLRTSYPAAFGQLRGVVLEDSVNSPAGSNMASSLQGLVGTSLPLYATASPDNSCNADQSGTKELVKDLPGRFHGVQIATGNHQDVFGTDTTGLQSLVCGTPKPVNTAAVRTLSAGWLNGFVGGSGNTAYLPGGSVYDRLVAAGTITTLP